MIKHITAIAFIFVCTSVAWVILGGTVDSRTEALDETSRDAVGELWGGPQVQQAPLAFRIETVERAVERAEDGQTVTETVQHENVTPLPLASSRMAVSLDLDHRKRGLLWYPTYSVAFHGAYTVRNPYDEPIRVRIRYAFPRGAQILDDFQFSLTSDIPAASPQDGEVVQEVEVAGHDSLAFSVDYRSQGVGSWRYAFGRNVQEVRDFRLEMDTDFAAIDFPDATLSPGEKQRTPEGWRLTWNYTRLLADAGIGIEMPERLNPGPWVSRVTFFAPVSLFLFFFLMFILSIIRDIRLHPMHYFFLAAAFFAFHLLLAYLVDHISVHVAVAIASITSLALVISYMRLVVNARFALVEVGLAQAVYLIGFAYTFFLPGYTGLAVTILSIVTLFLVMQATARLDWEETFRSSPLGVTPDGSSQLSGQSAEL